MKIQKDKISKIKPNNNEALEIVNVIVTGRIFNYFFGAVKEDYLKECKMLVSNGADNFNSIEELLNSLIIPNEFEDNLEVFKSHIDTKILEDKCPNFLALLERIKEKNISTRLLYQTIFNLSPHNLDVVENDAFITIKVDGKEVIKDQKMEDFVGENVDVDYDADADAETKTIIQEFIKANKVIYNIDDEDIVSTYKSSNGVKTIQEWIEHQDLTEFKSGANNIQICQDNIMELSYRFKTKKFDLSKLILLGYVNMCDFHKSAASYMYSYLLYDSNTIDPKKKILGIKQHELSYESKRGSLAFLLEG